MKAHQRSILRHGFLLSLLLGALFSWNVMTGLGQENGPKRGFQPGGAFALSDIESINTTNGNMMMHFPLGSLPAGRNGLTAGITLLYSSKLYNSRTRWVRDYGKACETGAGGGPQTCFYYQRHELEETTDGGWHYAMGYSIEVIDRTQDGSLDPNLQCDQYGSPLTYRYKLRVHFPDGSVHEMRPSGFADGYQNDVLGDYFNVLPDGHLYSCSQASSWSTASTISYYSTDGTFLRLEFQAGNHGGWWNNSWTLYSPDGSRVTGTGWGLASASERIYDRNGNYVDVSTYAANGHDYFQLADQFSRTVTLKRHSSLSEDDEITSQGLGETLVWKVRWKNIRVDKDYWPCPESLMPCQTQDSNTTQHADTFIHDLGVVDHITLPAQVAPNSSLSYTFSYNAPDYTSGSFSTSTGWGELSGITLPSGARATYDLEMDGSPMGATTPSTPDVMKNFPTAKHLVYRPENDVSSVSNTPCESNCITETWTYDTADNNGFGSVTGPDGGVSKEYAIPNSYGVDWQPWNAGMSYKSERPDGSKTERIWAKNKLGDYGTYETMRGDNPYVKTEFTSIKNAAGSYVKTAIKDYTYDKNGNVTSAKEYDWLDYSSVSRDSAGNPTGIPSGATPSRITTNSYYNSTPDASQSPSGYGNVYWYQSAPLFKNAIASSEVSQGSTVFSRTEFSYDNYSTTGNLTQKTSWDSAKGSYSNPLTTSNSVSVSTQYNDYGMPTQVTDARGSVTAITYGSVSGVSNLYPTQTVTAYGTSIARTETRAYDLATGLMTSVTDYDNNVTTSTTYDPFGRPTLVKAADGITGVEARTATEYSDVNRRVIVRSDLSATGDAKLVSIQHYDQLGRVRLSRQLEDVATQDPTVETTGIKVQTRYAFSGSNSYTLSSNPYRASTSGGASGEGTMGWTRSKSDNTGRMIEMQTFGGSSLPAPWGSSSTSTGTVTTAYDANFTTLTDQAGKLRRSMTNGLGQLVRADEPDGSGSLGTASSPNQATSYAYDTLGNLVTVNQGSQTRTFTYSSLARLLTATNPESGTLTYTYDANGNLLTKTDARTVVSTYAYDALNRPTTRSYSDSTPAVTYTYDSVSAFGKGRLASVSSSVSSYSYSSYDALGRALGGTQTISSQNYPVGYTYDRAGHLLTESYPSGRTVTNAYDNTGRLSSFTGNLGDGTTRTYSSITGTNAYDAAGHLTQEQFGTTTAVFNKLAYNPRGELVTVLASTSGNDTTFNRGKIVNDYGTTDNNGNLKQQTVYVPNNDQNTSPISWYQQYGYDSLNRLTQVHEYTGNTNLDSQQSYSYDRWGNRLINNNSSATWGDGINNVVATIDQSNNRMFATNDSNHTYIDYDAAGNQTKDYLTSNGTRTYDAENRMITANDSSNHTSTYSYDGDGHRVKRNVNGTETWQLYGLGGELLAEYAANTAASTPQKEYGYRNGQLLVTAEPSVVGTNVALATNGAVATASSALSSAYPASGANDGDRKGLNWGYGGGWNEAGPANTFPDWLQVDFNGSKTISEIDVFSIQDHYNWPVEPTGAMTFTLYGLTGYEVQYWDGTSWVTIPGGSVSGNNQVWRKFTFAAVSTTKIRVSMSASSDGWSRLAEVEAWTGPSPTPRYDEALAANGAVATASSSYSAVYGPSGVNNGDRKSLNWGNSGGWNDPGQPFPDWLQIDFAGSKTIEEIDVYTLQDNWGGSVEPTEAMTFSQWGVTGYDVQYWDGSAWVTVTSGSVTGNNKVWRKFTFSAINTTKIRVLTNASVDGYSRLTEVEAYGPAAGAANIHWLVTDQLGTPRMIFDQSGSLANVSRHDYLPFGEELGVGQGSRTQAQGYTLSDNVRQKFTSKERDLETGLDYFGARFYASMQGRFTGTDPMLIDVKKLSDPQRIDAYVYARNNPLRFVDPDGADPIVPKTAKININRDAHYPAKGNTPDEAWKDAHTKGPFAPYQGNTDPRFDLEGQITAVTRRTRHGFTSTATGANLQLVVTITVSTPQWQSPSPDNAIAASDNQKFQDANNKLKAHEEGHVQYDVAGANEMQERVNAVRVTATAGTSEAAQNLALAGAKSQIDNIQNAVIQRTNKANANYDQVTEHGEQQGKAPAKFELPEQGP